MTKNRWEGAGMKSFGRHMDPEKEEQMKWMKIGNKYNYNTTSTSTSQPKEIVSPHHTQPLQFQWRLWDSSLLKTKRTLFKASSFHDHRHGYLWHSECQLVLKIQNKVKRILKLVKSINGNKDGSLKRKTEVAQSVEDIQREYEALYSLYEDLRTQVRKKVHIHDDDNSLSPSTSDSESYYSPTELYGKNAEITNQPSEEPSNSQTPDTSDLEDTILKDKLTHTSEVKKPIDFDPASAFSKLPELGEADHSESTKQMVIEASSLLKDKLVQREEDFFSVVKKYQDLEVQNLDRIKELEDQVSKLTIEQEELNMKKTELEKQIECKTDEVKQLKEKILDLEKPSKDKEKFGSSQKGITKEVKALQHEIESLNRQKHGLELKLREKAKESEEKDVQFSAMMKRFEEKEAHYVSRIEDLVAQTNNMRVEMNTLNTQIAETELQLKQERKEASAQVKGLTDGIEGLQRELDSVNEHKTELETRLREKCKETSDCLNEIENFKRRLTQQSVSEQGTVEEKEGLREQVKDLKVELKRLSSQKNDLEEHILSINHEARHSEVEKDEMKRKISELQAALQEGEKELSGLQKKFTLQEENMSTQITSMKKKVNKLEKELEYLQYERNQLQKELEREKQDSAMSKSQMEKRNTELSNMVAEQETTLGELECTISRLKLENENLQAKAEANFQTAERRIDEMAEEFRKQFEDNLRILSRRIRVAEQLHAENKEWYKKTMDTYAQENKNLKERVGKTEVGLRNVKGISLTANDILTSLDNVGLKFEECTAHFLNRISKSSCELKFAKDWVMRKNRALGHVKDDLDCLLAQLDDKEAEILIFREKVWKSENKIRELEKMIKEKEEGIIDLKEEKREAIRQLCVWIDYHRSRSDYYKKLLEDLTPRFRRTS